MAENSAQTERGVRQEIHQRERNRLEPAPMGEDKNAGNRCVGINESTKGGIKANRDECEDKDDAMTKWMIRDTR